MNLTLSSKRLDIWLDKMKQKPQKKEIVTHFLRFLENLSPPAHAGCLRTSLRFGAKSSVKHTRHQLELFAFCSCAPEH